MSTSKEEKDKDSLSDESDTNQEENVKKRKRSNVFSNISNADRKVEAEVMTVAEVKTVDEAKTKESRKKKLLSNINNDLLNSNETTFEENVSGDDSSSLVFDSSSENKSYSEVKKLKSTRIYKKFKADELIISTVKPSTSYAASLFKKTPIKSSSQITAKSPIKTRRGLTKLSGTSTPTDDVDKNNSKTNNISDKTLNKHNQSFEIKTVSDTSSSSGKRL